MVFMVTGKLTLTSVKTLKPGDRDVFLWDADIKGFGLKRTPTGRAVFLVQYRLYGGRSAKTRRYTIGSLGVWTPETAGKEAGRLLRMVAQGVDPAEEKIRRRIEAKELAFSAYADSFLKREVTPNWPKSYAFAESIIRVHLKPHFKDTPLPDIDGRRLTRFFDSLDHSAATKRNAFAVLRRMFRWAKGRHDIAVNPIADFDGPAPVASRDRWLKEWELKALLRVTDALPSPGPAFIRMLLITGQRRNEVSGLHWGELDRDGRVWVLPGVRAKNGVEHLVPLSDRAVLELDAIAGGDTWPSRGLLFPGGDDTPFSAFSKLKKALDVAMLEHLKEDDEGARIEPWRLHDLRRSQATHLQRLGTPNEHIEAVQNRLAGRSKPGAGKAYLLWEFEPEKRTAQDKWGAFVTGLAADQSQAGNTAAKG